MAPRILWVSTPILAKYSGQVIAETGTLLEVTREPLGQLLCARLPLGPQYHGRVEVFLAEDLPDLLTFGPDFGAECRLRAAHDADDHALPRAERKHVAYLERFLVSIATKLAGQSFAEDGLDVGVDRRRAGQRLSNPCLREPGAA